MTRPISPLTESAPVATLNFPSERFVSKITFSHDVAAEISADLLAPSMTLFFTLDPNEVTKMFEFQRTSASFSPMTDEPAYNTLVRQSSDQTTSFSFLGNLSDTLSRLLAYEILSEKSVLIIQSKPKIKSLLDASKSWFVSISGALEMKKPSNASSKGSQTNSLFSSDHPGIFNSSYDASKKTLSGVDHAPIFKTVI